MSSGNTIDKKKGFDYLLKAVDKLNDKDQYHLLIIGKIHMILPLNIGPMEININLVMVPVNQLLLIYLQRNGVQQRLVLICNKIYISGIFSFSLLSKTEKSFVLINFTAILQFILIFAPVIALRLTFMTILVSVLSFAILKKYSHVKIFELRLYSLYINTFILVLLSLAPTLTTYRSLLPF